MNTTELKPNKNSTSKRKRKGRGNAAGQGGECGRGHKGQKSRSGYSRRAGFEGGQNPLYKRLPKLKGFKPLLKFEYDIVNLNQLENLFSENETIDKFILQKKGLIRGNQKLKVLGDGVITKKLTVIADSFSKTARTKIEKLKGECKLK